MIWGIIFFLVGGFLGYWLCALLIARDQKVVRLGDDDVVVKRPGQGMVLASVPPSALRRLVAEREGGSDQIQARDLYR